MRRLFLIPVLTIALIGVVKGQETVEDRMDPEVQKEILKGEEELHQGFLKGDTAMLDRNFDDHISWTTAYGEQLTKAQVLDDVRTGKQKFQSPIKHDDVHIHAYGDTVVVTGRSTTTYQYKGKPSASARRITNVWVKRNGKWWVVAHQATAIAQP
jgi:hypothetical protein